MIHDESRVLADALVRISNGSNNPFLVLAVFDLGNLLGEHGINIATFNITGNKKAHLCSATDDQVKQCREEKVDQWRFVGLNKVLPS